MEKKTKKKNNIIVTLGAVAICILLLCWIIIRTVQKSQEENMDKPATLESAP